MIAVRRLSEMDVLSRKSVLLRPGVVTSELLATVNTIVSDVRDHGDSAVRAYSEKFDKVKLDVIQVSAEELNASGGQLTAEQRTALDTAAARVKSFHERGLPTSFECEAGSGVRLGRRVVPFQRAGIYVPGGLASYPTCVIMNAVPARVAGVKELILCTPPPISPSVLYAARISGVTTIFKVGGAQAIAAMAYGTATIPRVEIIIGPGNRFVTCAKKIVSNDVAIDFLAGPTELMVLSDGTGTPRFIAADLIAQAEHDPAACTILITTSESQARAVAGELKEQVGRRERREIIETALTRHGAILVADRLEEAIAFANEYGPEHLAIFCADPMKVLDGVRNAGAVFLGDYSPVAAGDYCAGPNSTLPTLGDARRFSGLSAATFMKSITYEHLTREGLQELAGMASTLAGLESLEGHRASIDVRLERGH